MKNFAEKLAGPISLDEWPSIECPHCGDGTLNIGAPEHHADPCYKSDYWNLVSGDPTEIHGIFSALLTCNARRCGHVTIAVGDFTVDELPYRNEPFFEEKYMIRGFYPPVAVVGTTDSVPDSVRVELARIGGLVWSDPGAATTAMRASVERILDDQGIDAKTAMGGYRPLRQRIEEFKKVKPEIGSLLEAIKNVGNEGTHSSGTQARADVLRLVGIIETVVEILYVPSKHAHAQTLAASINDNANLGG
jgi:hypothetical protein